MAALLSCELNNDIKMWFVHVLVGDGINTNEAAARRLLARALVEPLGQLRYFLAAYKCSSHQANLAAKGAVIGAAAKVAAATGADSDIAGQRPHLAVCGAAARLYKYLINFYFDEFALAIHMWVAQAMNLEQLPPATARPQLKARPSLRRPSGAFGLEWTQLRSLYGNKVVTDELISFAAAAATGAGEEDAASLATHLVQTLLVVDEHPTLTRFWTFRGAIDRMLCMVLTGADVHALRLTGRQPRPENQRRLQAVRGFLADNRSRQYLRRCSLCLRLTAVATSITGQTAKKHSLPLIVRLSQREVQDEVAVEFRSIICALHEDTLLDVAAAITALLATVCDLELRFAQYEDYPSALWKLTRRFNPVGWPSECLTFVQTPRHRLDVGLSLPLQKLALESGSEAGAVRFLSSERVQEALELFLCSAVTTTLEVERRHAQVKRCNEARKVMHIAAASRNAMLRRMQARYAAKGAAITIAATEKRKITFTKATSLAWKELPQAVPEGRRFGQRSCSASDLDALRAHVHANRERFNADLQVQRDQAAGRLAAATSADWVPSSVEAWTARLAEREECVRELLAKATTTRRSRSYRLEAAPDMPEPVLRIRPQPQPPGAASMTSVEKLLRGRTGWFFVAYAKELRMLFIANYAGHTFAVDSRPFVAKDGKSFRVGPTFCAKTHLKPLDSLSLPSAGRVFEARVKASADEEGVTVCPTTCKEVTGPAKRQAKEEDDAEGEEASDGGDSMEEWEAVKADAGSVVTSVDTDVDTDVDHTDGEIDAEHAAEAEDRPCDDRGGATDIVMAAATGAEPADDVEAAASGAGDVPRAATGTFVLWRNEYFFISYHGQEYIRIRVYVRWLTDEEMGRTAQSRNIRPSIYGEDIHNCPKCQLVLRAWAVWRMKLDDWAERRLGRLRQVAADEAKVEADVRALGEDDGLLGTTALNTLLRAYIPDAFLRLERAAAAASGAVQ